MSPMASIKESEEQIKVYRLCVCVRDPRKQMLELMGGGGGPIKGGYIPRYVPGYIPGCIPRYLGIYPGIYLGIPGCIPGIYLTQL